MLVDIYVGDHWGDGHEKFEKYSIESNFSGQKIQEAYKEGCKVVGFDLIKTYCVDYEDSIIPLKHIKKLLELGLEKDDEILDTNLEMLDEKDTYGLNVDEFFKIYLFICTLGNKNFRYDIINSTDSIDIGGYGLFY